MRKFFYETVRCTALIGGGQALAEFESGKKVFIWNALPGELVKIQVYKKKASYCEAVATEIIEHSPHRIAPKDPGSYLSTSPWQIMDYDFELASKAQLIREAFELSHVDLPGEVTVETDCNDFHYRNKVEFSFYFDKDLDELSLAFFRRGSHGKIAVKCTSLAREEINSAAQRILTFLRSKRIEGRALKTLLIRTSQTGVVAGQLYVKDEAVAGKLAETLRQEDSDQAFLDTFLNFEIIFSNPKSPASVITKRFFASTDRSLSDTILDQSFSYATEGFFQINLPVYEMALREMQRHVHQDKVVDMYSGVGSIGLTIGGREPTLVEVNEAAVSEMRRNAASAASNAKIVLAKSEDALHHIASNAILIVDPPRAGLHDKVCQEILRKAPPRVMYLSCNPVTQARDIVKLLPSYDITLARGYNFFPRTPHIEHLVVLDRKL